MSDETPEPQQPSALNSILAALNSLGEFVSQHAPEPAPEMDAAAGCIVYLRSTGPLGAGLAIPFVDGCNAEITETGGLIVWRRVEGGSEEIARIYAPGVWEYVDFPPGVER